MSGAVHLDGVRPGGRVVVAMSGGVDSSVAAALLAEAGYDVVGITLQLYDHGAATQKKGACCAGQDIHDARAVADRIGIPHYVLDYEQRFRDDVIERFADSYAAGETPVPCIACNQTVKFRDLLGTARDLGAEAMATGHYVRRLVGAEGPEMHRAIDPARDQSYFLFATTAEQLAFLRFPLGGMEKAETRAHAERLGLAIAAKPDSQDICFVPSGRYAGIVERLRPDAHKPGEIVHLDGRVLGTHAGIAHFTIGQRRGIRVGGEAAGGDPLYVVRLDAERARVLVGPREALARDTIHLRDLNLLGSVPAGGLDLSVKLRSVQAPAPARLVGSTVTLAEPQYGISPGQACVFYQGDRVLGGGWIAATDRAALAAA